MKLFANIANSFLLSDLNDLIPITYSCSYVSFDFHCKSNGLLPHVWNFDHPFFHAHKKCVRTETVRTDFFYFLIRKTTLKKDIFFKL